MAWLTRRRCCMGVMRCFCSNAAFCDSTSITCLASYFREHGQLTPSGLPSHHHKDPRQAEGLRHRSRGACSRTTAYTSANNTSAMATSFNTETWLAKSFGKRVYVWKDLTQHLPRNAFAAAAPSNIAEAASILGKAATTVITRSRLTSFTGGATRKLTND